MAIHFVKCTPNHFSEVLTERKKFEIRFNDRDYQIGDFVVLEEYILPTATNSGYYTGRYVLVDVLDIFDISDLFAGYVAFNFRLISNRLSQKILKRQQKFLNKR